MSMILEEEVVVTPSDAAAVFRPELSQSARAPGPCTALSPCRTATLHTGYLGVGPPF